MTLQSWRDFLLAELQRRNAINAARPPRARMRFIVWTINDGSDLCALVGAGVDGIMTDDPGRLRAIVQHWGQPGHCPFLRNETHGTRKRGLKERRPGRHPGQGQAWVTLARFARSQIERPHPSC